MAAWYDSEIFYYIVRTQLNIITTVEELLIDFRELIGEHSGENLADAVYETLQLYNLKDKVRTSTSSPTCYAVLMVLYQYIDCRY
jgi:hypothetical protein